MPRLPLGFLSYAKVNDRDTDGRVSELRRVLEAEVRNHGVEDFELFQDTDTEGGAAWERRILDRLDAATYFIPILTPTFFARPWCRRETDRFLARPELAAGRVVVYPLYFIEDPDLEDEEWRGDDPRRVALHARQYRDVRSHRIAGFGAGPGRALLAECGKEIAHRLKLLRRQEEAGARAADHLRGRRFVEAAVELRKAKLADEAEAVIRVGEQVAAGDWAPALEVIRAHVGGWAAEGWRELEEQVAAEEARVVAARKAEEARQAAGLRGEEARKGDEGPVIQAPAEMSVRSAKGDVGPHQTLEAGGAARVDALGFGAAVAAITDGVGSVPVIPALNDNGPRAGSAGRTTRRARPQADDASSPGALRHTALPDLAPLRLVYIPAGPFWMGSADGVGDEDEHPRHRVRLTRPFLAGATPVTQAQWRAVAKAAGLPESPSHFKGETHPVETVSWFDAVRWCNALSTVEKRPPAYTIGTGDAPLVTVDRRAASYRLPSEAEWEYLCRADTETRWCFGDEEGALEAHGWFAGNAGGRTHPVGEKPPNPWGLYDVHGNVSEWCGDAWCRRYTKSPADDPFLPPAVGGRRVFRGGSWGNVPGGCRSAYRFGRGPVGRGQDQGFRVVMPLPLGA